ncbi:hypothetical protein Nepgr_005355 [Nepenthes gracilis]|uniref:Uncharacterized protein n=1 Tax=Nepenthes gracilis TaxID=150966 RepID=A0AAD3S3E3_NEPGR|nr:hypothetical protein Nepgr_005355 [Nepenthes gracilis]
MGFESILPSPLTGIGGAGVSMDGHGAVSSRGSPPPPSMTTIPSETGNPSLVSLSVVDSADFRVEAFPSLPIDNIQKDRVCPPGSFGWFVLHLVGWCHHGWGLGLLCRVMAVSFVLMQFLMALGSGYDAAASTFAVASDSTFPSKIRIGSGSTSPLTVEPAVEIHVSYPWKPKRRNSILPDSVGSPKQPMAVPAPRAYSKPAVPESGIDCATGRSETMKSRDPGIERTSLVVPRADLQPHQLFGHSETNVPLVSYADALNCGLGIPPPAADEFLIVDSVDQSSDASPFKALDQAPSLKVVRFAPEILSAEAPSCAPHRRMLAPCSDICHPIKFCESNLGNLASDGIAVDGGPKLASPPFAPRRETRGVVPLDDALSSIDILPYPGADIENQDLSIPPSDGMTLELEPASTIDPNLMPSPISHISKKYFPVASNFGEPFSSSSNGSLEWTKKKTRSRIKPCKAK